MRTGGALTFELGTPEEVLEVLRAWYATDAAIDPGVEAGIELTMDTTIERWRDAGDLLPAEELAVELDAAFGTELGVETWRGVLEPPDERTLEHVCVLVADHALFPRLGPARIAGKDCRGAGAFLAFRELLRRGGVPVEGVRPSCPLGPILRHHLPVVLRELARLTRRVPPPVRIEDPARDRWLATYGAGLLGLTVGWLADVGWLAWLGAAAVGPAFVGLWASGRRPPARVVIQGWETFRDLAEWILEES